MNNTHTPAGVPRQPELYEIRIKGNIDARLSARFECLSCTCDKDGTTKLTCPVPDQAALHGLLRKVRDLGLLLVSVFQVITE